MQEASTRQARGRTEMRTRDMGMPVSHKNMHSQDFLATWQNIQCSMVTVAATGNKKLSYRLETGRQQRISL